MTKIRTGKNKKNTIAAIFIFVSIAVGIFAYHNINKTQLDQVNVEAGQNVNTDKSLTLKDPQVPKPELKISDEQAITTQPDNQVKVSTGDTKVASKPTPTIKLPTNSTKIIFDKTWKLPFKPGAKVYVEQGYNSQFSHKDKYALDFISSNAQSILAARGGIVTEIYGSGKWDQWCRSWQECLDKGSIWNGNYITILHSDGSQAKYLHLKPGSTNKNLAVGATIKQGEFLGLMGGSGYTCLTPECKEPEVHLHFELQFHDSQHTIPTPFYECNLIQNKCSKDGWLLEGNNYIN